MHRFWRWSSRDLDPVEREWVFPERLLSEFLAKHPLDQVDIGGPERPRRAGRWNVGAKHQRTGIFLCDGLKRLRHVELDPPEASRLDLAAGRDERSHGARHESVAANSAKSATIMSG